MMVSLSVSFVKWSYASFLLFAVALMFASGNAEAKDPEWGVDIGQDVNNIVISADGEYIAVGGENKIFLNNFTKKPHIFLRFFMI